MENRERAEDQVVAMLAAARARDRAPQALRERIERERARGSGSAVLPRWLGRRAFAGGLVAAVAAAVLVVALALPSGTPGLPSISQAAAEAVRPADRPAPAAAGPILRERVGGVSFPNWASRLGYTAVGERRGRLGGQSAVTVAYERDGETVYYLITSGRIRWPSVPVRRVGNLQIRALRLAGSAVVTWRRGNDTCVLVSSQLTTAELASLADWTDGGTRQLGAERDAAWPA
jgi:hypothetical protein